MSTTHTVAETGKNVLFLELPGPVLNHYPLKSGECHYTEHTGQIRKLVLDERKLIQPRPRSQLDSEGEKASGKVCRISLCNYNRRDGFASSVW